MSSHDVLDRLPVQVRTLAEPLLGIRTHLELFKTFVNDEHSRHDGIEAANELLNFIATVRDATAGIAPYVEPFVAEPAHQWTSGLLQDLANLQELVMSGGHRVYELWADHMRESEGAIALRYSVLVNSDYSILPPKLREATSGKKRGRGRPGDTDPKSDERLWNSWKTGSFKTYRDFAPQHRVSENEARRAIDRHRKRINRAME